MSGFYDDGLEQLLARTIPEAAEVYVVGVNDTYTYSKEHKLLADYEDSIVLPELLLAGRTFFNGFLKAPNLKWAAAGTGLPPGTSLELQGVIIYFRDGSTRWLLAFIDTAQVGLPQTLTGVDVTAHWEVQGILKI